MEAAFSAWLNKQEGDGDGVHYKPREKQKPSQNSGSHQRGVEDLGRERIMFLLPFFHFADRFFGHDIPPAALNDYT